jgi:transposase InsO family protein
VLVDLAVMIADGGEAICDIDELRHQGEVFGPVASDTTVWRALDEIGATQLRRIAVARARVRARMWQLFGGPPAARAAGREIGAGVVVLDVDSTIVLAHSDKDGAAATYFSAPAGPNLAGVGDLTEIPTGEGSFHLAVILRSALAAGARVRPGRSPRRRAGHRGAAGSDRGAAGGDVAGVIFQCGQGGEYAGEVARAAGRRARVRRSMGRTGSTRDNAVAAAFDCTLQFALLADARLLGRAQARAAVAGFIDEYNTERRHSSAGRLPPAGYEARIRVGQAA